LGQENSRATGRSISRTTRAAAGPTAAPVTENVTQGAARDVLAAALQRLEPAGYPIALHVHDEVVCEIAEDADQVETFLALLTKLPDCAEGLPIAAKVWTGKRYTKSRPNTDDTSPPVPRPAAVTEPTAVNGAGLSVASASAPIAPEDDAESPMLADLIGEPLDRSR
jgi:hypothetical protein